MFLFFSTIFVLFWCCYCCFLLLLLLSFLTTNSCFCCYYTCFFVLCNKKYRYRIFLWFFNNVVYIDLVLSVVVNIDHSSETRVKVLLNWTEVSTKGSGFNTDTPGYVLHVTRGGIVTTELISVWFFVLNIINFSEYSYRLWFKNFVSIQTVNSQFSYTNSRVSPLTSFNSNWSREWWTWWNKLKLFWRVWSWENTFLHAC